MSKRRIWRAEMVGVEPFSLFLLMISSLAQWPRLTCLVFLQPLPWILSPLHFLIHPQHPDPRWSPHHFCFQDCNNLLMTSLPNHSPHWCQSHVLKNCLQMLVSYIKSPSLSVQQAKSPKPNCTFISTLNLCHSSRCCQKLVFQAHWQAHLFLRITGFCLLSRVLFHDWNAKPSLLLQATPQMSLFWEVFPLAPSQRPWNFGPSTIKRFLLSLTILGFPCAKL